MQQRLKFTYFCPMYVLPTGRYTSSMVDTFQLSWLQINVKCTQFKPPKKWFANERASDRGNQPPAVGQQLEKTGSFANCTTHPHPTHDVNAPTRTTANHDDSFYNEKCTVSCHELYYRAPIESMKHQHQHQQQNHPSQWRRPTTIVFGILSGSGEAES
jgi:hypothetical protein